MKYNIFDNFEDVYMRTKTLTKTLGGVDQNIFNDVDFKKTVKYLTYVSHKKHGQYLIYNGGFDIDDIRSMVMVFASSFVGANFFDKDADKRKYYLLMIKYVSQRIHMWREWAGRKFGDTESVAQFNSSIETYSNIKGSVDSNETRRSHLETDIEEMKNSLESGNFLNKQDLLNQIKVKKIRLYSRRNKIRNKTNQLKKRLEKDIGNKKQILAYYASTKHTSFDMRKAARRLCKKYGIDYKNHAESETAANWDLDRDFNV